MGHVLPPCAKKRRKFTAGGGGGGPRRSRNNVGVTTERTGSKRKRGTREMDQGGSFQESFDIPTFPPRSSWGYSSPFVFVSRRADSPANSVHCVILHRQMCQNCKCVRSDERHVERRRRRFDRNRARIPRCEL